MIQRQLTDLGVKGFQIDGWRHRFGTSLSPKYPGGLFEQLRLPLGDLVGGTSNCCVSWANVFSPLIAAKATFALKAGAWFRRGRLLIVSLDSGHFARYQAETPLIPLSKFAEQPLYSRPSEIFAFVDGSKFATLTPDGSVI